MSSSGATVVVVIPDIAVAKALKEKNRRSGRQLESLLSSRGVVLGENLIRNAPAPGECPALLWHHSGAAVLNATTLPDDVAKFWKEGKIYDYEHSVTAT